MGLPITKIEEDFLLRKIAEIKNLIGEFVEKCLSEGLEVVSEDNEIIIKESSRTLVISTRFLDPSIIPNHIDILGLENSMRIYGDEIEFVIFMPFIHLSGLRFILENSDKFLGYVISTNWCLGQGNRLSRLFREFIMNRIKFNELRVGYDLPHNQSDEYLLLHQRSLLLEETLYDLAKKFESVRKLLDSDYLENQIKSLLSLVATNASEDKLRSLMINLLELVGFRINKQLSGKPGHADIIITNPIRIVIEIKRETGNEDSVLQALNYSETYSIEGRFDTLKRGLKWIPVLVAPRFKLEAINIATEMKVSLLTFQDFANLIKLLGIHGLSTKGLLHLLRPGLCSDIISEELKAREKEVEELCMVLSAGRMLREIRSDERLREVIRRLFKRDISNEKIRKYLTSFMNIPVDIIQESSGKLLFDRRVLFFSLIRFFNNLLKKVKKYESFPVS